MNDRKEQFVRIRAAEDLLIRDLLASTGSTAVDVVDDKPTEVKLEQRSKFWQEYERKHLS